MPSRVAAPSPSASGHASYLNTQNSGSQSSEFTFTFTPPITPDFESTSSLAQSTHGSPATVLPSKRAKANRVPRPPNPFIVFRSHLIQEEAKNIGERDFRHISRIAGYRWKNLSDMERKVFQDKAEELKQIHIAKHPGYTFQPVKRTAPKPRRNVGGNSAAHLNKCKNIAEFMASGLQGEELSAAIASLPPIDPEPPRKKRRTIRNTASTPAKKEESPLSTSDSASPSSYTSALDDRSSLEPAPLENQLYPPHEQSPHYDVAALQDGYASYNSYDEVYQSSYYNNDGRLFAEHESLNPYIDYPHAAAAIYDPNGLYAEPFHTYDHAPMYAPQNFPNPPTIEVPSWPALSGSY